MKHQIITIVLGEVAVELRGELFRPQAVKSAPLYSDAHIPRQVLLGKETVAMDGQDVVFELKGYAPDILLIQARVDVPQIFRKETFALEQAIYQQAYRILEARGGNPHYSEEYTVFAVTNYEGPPDAILLQHGPLIASLLKSERLELDPNEVDYTLSSQIKYAKNDLSIIDWDGAFLFDPDGHTEEDLELLTLANLQLLRHRILDRQLEDRLGIMAELVRNHPLRKTRLRTKELAQDLREIIKTRMTSINDLQRIERDIKLIGDWYSARFYELAATKFKIDDWRRDIGNKLESLEDVYSLVAENFAVSTKQQAEWIQIILFFILQVGWFCLLILEFFYFTRK